MTSHAYLIMAHNNFPLLLELIAMLDHPRHSIYLHIDQKVSDAEFLQLKKDYTMLKEQRKLCSPLTFTDRISVHWGGYSQIACELLLLEAASQHGPFAYYHLLSGSDLPIKAPECILSFFDDHIRETDGGLEFLDFDAPTVPAYVRERISLYHILRESSHPLAEPLDAVFTKVQRVFRVDRLKKLPLTIQKGANWFSITENFVRYILEHKEAIPRIFGRSVCADELFLQTMAVNSPFAERIFDPYGRRTGMSNLRFVDWERGANNNPYVFQKEDRELLLALPHLFARKFRDNIL